MEKVQSLRSPLGICRSLPCCVNLLPKLLRKCILYVVIVPIILPQLALFPVVGLGVVPRCAFELFELVVFLD